MRYHWSLMQVEYASDLVFKRAADLRPLYESISRTYKYYLTRLGRVAVLTALKLRDLVVIPTLAQPASA